MHNRKTTKYQTVVVRTSCTHGEHYATKQAVVVGLRDERHGGSRGGEARRWQGRRDMEVAGEERHGGGRLGETWRWQEK